MRRIILLLYLFVLPVFFYGQNVGIGTNSPHASALLDVSSTSKGLLIPRMTAAQMNVIASPAVGLFIYNTNDSSFYTRRLASWNKISYGEDHLWRKFGNKTFLGTGNYLGINYSDFAAQNLIGNYAPLQTRGMVGNTIAEFGEDVQGISLVGNYPGVFFNSYFNSGVKSIAAGGTGNITLNQSNPHYFEFSFGDYASFADQAVTNTVRMALRSDGRLFLGNGNIDFSRANFEQQGSIGATSAIFGGDGTGISLQKNWPAIGFNSYLDASNHKSISVGYGAQLGLNQQNGSLYLVSFPFNAQPNALFSGYTQRFFISQLGRVGIGIDAPISDLHIMQRVITDQNEGADVGITMEGIINNSEGSFNSKWNLHTGRYGDGLFAGLGGLVFWNNNNNGGWYSKAAIGIDGSYYNISDLNRKKDIKYLESGYLSKIMQLLPCTYHYKSEEDNEPPLNVGFIAQEVEKIFPEFIATFSDSKMIAYSKFIPILTKGIQEQQQQFEDLKKDNEKLKNEIAELRKLILSKQ